jgi:hypothetical protein
MVRPEIPQDLQVMRFETELVAPEEVESEVILDHPDHPLACAKADVHPRTPEQAKVVLTPWVVLDKFPDVLASTQRWTEACKALQNHRSRAEGRDRSRVEGTPACSSLDSAGGLGSPVEFPGRWLKEGVFARGMTRSQIIGSLRPALDVFVARGARSGDVLRPASYGLTRTRRFVGEMDLLDQPWKIARMNKFSLALALGAGLVLCLAGPSADAAPIVQNLAAPEMTSAQFNSLFTPVPGVSPLTSSYQFMGTPATGLVESQVFQGQGAAAGLYAYGYQIAVNNVSDGNGQPTSVNSAALQFNATPVAANFTDPNGTKAATYIVKDGPVGGLNLPQAASGDVIQSPTSVAWLPGTKTGALTFQYLDATKNTGPLQAGATSATIVVLTNQPYTTQPVSLQNANPQITYPTAYSAQGGDIHQVPVPEPSTVLAWAGMIGAVALVRQIRKGRMAA